MVDFLWVFLFINLYTVSWASLVEGKFGELLLSIWQKGLVNDQTNQ